MAINKHRDRETAAELKAFECVWDFHAALNAACKSTNPFDRGARDSVRFDWKMSFYLMKVEVN